MHEASQGPSGVAAAIIEDDGRFLTIRRADNGRWLARSSAQFLSSTDINNLARANVSPTTPCATSSATPATAARWAACSPSWRR